MESGGNLNCVASARGYDKRPGIVKDADVDRGRYIDRKRRSTEDIQGGAEVVVAIVDGASRDDG